MTGAATTTAPDLVTWSTRVRDWFEARYDRRTDTEPDERSCAVFHDLDAQAERAMLTAVRGYRRARFDAGYGALTLARQYGGAGLPALYAAVFSAIEKDYATPVSTELISVTTSLVAPSVAMFGSEKLRAAVLTGLLRTDLLACQLFSEPAAGSDLAAVACKAVRSADWWVLRGQKVWTSGARFADFGLLLARSNPDVPKHSGITAFLVPMDAEGVTVRPIRQMSGGCSFNEVFLDDVAVADTARIGQVDGGWQVATTTLAFERQASGSGTRRKGGTVDDLIAAARRVGALADPRVSDLLVDLYVRNALRQATTQRVQRAALVGQAPGPAASVGKLISSDLLVRIGEAAAEVLGDRVGVDHGDGYFGWTEHLLGAPGYRLAGGTDQIQRNIIAERVLGLPAEHRADKGVPFSALTSA